MTPTQPTERQLKALSRIRKLESGHDVVINPADAEECEDRGWAEAQPSGGYRLTEAGRLVLTNANSN